MNKTYKSIFNESTGTYVAVSETAKSKTKGAASISIGILGAILMNVAHAQTIDMSNNISLGTSSGQGSSGANNISIGTSSGSGISPPGSGSGITNPGDPPTVNGTSSGSGISPPGEGSGGSNPGDPAMPEVKAGKNVFVSSELGDNSQTIYTVATKDEVDFSKVTVGGLTIDKSNVDAAGNTIISGVGAGELSSTSTDAVNGSQLYATNQQVAKNTTDITNINTTLDKGLSFSADSGPAVNRKLGDTVAITGDKSITTTTTANGVQIKLSDNIDVKNVNVSQSITVAEGAKVDMGGNVIQNVAPGVNGTDAVNVNQVNAAAGNLNNRINRVGHIANAGVAQAIATAGLPQAYLPGKSMMAVAGGTYEGETGYAIGFSTISDNGKWIIKVTGSGNSRDKYGASLGAGYQW